MPPSLSRGSDFQHAVAGLIIVGVGLQRINQQGLGNCDPEIKAAALKDQNGNGGFREPINRVLIVTTCFHGFCDPPERNQGFNDGGMFAMSLIYGLHSAGVATCPLNWCSSIEQDKGVRKELPIPENENFVMFIAVGHYPENFSAARA